MRAILQPKKGFTVAEAVVSIALIIMGTVMAITISYYCSSRTENAYMQYQAYNAAYDVINCYKEARNDYPNDLVKQETRFRNYLYYYNSNTELDVAVADGSYVYDFGSGSVKVKATVFYGQSEIVVLCYGGNSGREIYSIGYNVENNMEIGL